MTALRNYKSGQILPGQGTPLPPKPSDGPITQTMLAFDDNKLASTLFGQYGQNLALIERKLDVVADSRGNHVTIEGTREACDQARHVLESLYEQLRNGADLVAGDVEGAIRQAVAQGSLFDGDATTARPNFADISLRKRTVRARTAGGGERGKLWEEAIKFWPPYTDYQKKTEREIPVVVLDPVQ